MGRSLARIFFLIVVLVFLVGFSTAFGGGKPKIEQLTYDANCDEKVGIGEDGKVVWWKDDAITIDEDIYIYDGKSTVNITEGNTIVNNFPDIDHLGNVVFMGSPAGGGNSEIYLWNGVDTIRITNDSVIDSEPRISSGWVVWRRRANHSDYEIFVRTTWDEIIQVTNNSIDDISPKNSGDKIVWTAFDGNDTEIYFWSYSGGIVQVTNNDHDDFDPVIKGSYISWVGYRSDSIDHSVNDTEIFEWDGSVIRQVTDNFLPNSSPAVHMTLNEVLYVEEDIDGSHIYLKKSGGEKVKIFDGFTDDLIGAAGEKLIAWSHNNEIYLADLSTTPPMITRITEDSYKDFSPSVAGGKVAWVSWNGQGDFWNNREIKVAWFGGY